MNFSRLRDLGKLYPKSSIAIFFTILVGGGVLLNFLGITFGLSKFFASDPSEMSCGELGGNYCSQSGSCPDGAEDLGVTMDCSPCCSESSGDDGSDDGGGDSDDSDSSDDGSDDSSDDTNDDGGDSDDNNETSGSVDDVDPCADGDCDGDGFLNPVVEGGNDCDDGNASIFPGAGCEAATTSSGGGDTGTTSNGEGTEDGDGTTVTNTVDPCADGDCDGDGFLNPVVSGGNDCDDGNASVFPGNGCATTQATASTATQATASTATQAQESTTTQATESNVTTVDPCADGDCDGDGFLNPVVEGGDDCDDANPSVFPGSGCAAAQATATATVVATETTQATATVEATETAVVSTAPVEDPCADGDCDGDGFLNPQVSGGNDCDDSNAGIFPGNGCTATATIPPEPTATPEPGATTTPFVAPTATPDPCADGDCDGDGFLNPAVPGGNDCDDSNAGIFPGNGCAVPTTPTPTATLASTPQASPSNIFGQLDSPCIDLDCDNDGAARSTQVDMVDGTDCNDLSASTTNSGFDCDSDGVFNLQKPGVALAVSDCNDFDASQKLQCRAIAGGAPLVMTLTSDAALLTTSETTVISWESKDAVACTGDVFETGNKTTGSVVAGPFAATTTVNITCTNAKGVAAKSLEILVNVPATHLECVNATCSVVAGSGENTCASAGSSCQGGASLTSLINYFKGQGVQVDSGVTAACLETIKSSIDRLGSKGKLSRIKTGSGCGSEGCFDSNGNLWPGGCSSGIILHELAHSLYFSGQIKGAADSAYAASGGRSIAFQGNFSPANANANEMAGYGLAAFVADAGLQATARQFGPGGIQQYNFLAGLLGGQQISRVNSSSVSRLASILSVGFARVFGVDDPPAGTTGGDAPYASGPTITILSHQNGATISAVPVTVSGEVTSDYATSASIQKVRVEINRVFATDVTPGTGSCVAGVAHCKPWSTALNLKPGANEIRVIATDRNGVDSAPSVIMLNVPQSAGAAVSGATTLSVVSDPLFAVTTPRPTTSPRATSRPSGTVAGITSRIATGPGATTLTALGTAALISLLYVGYTGTNLFRRREAEEIARDNTSSEHHDMDFKS